MKYVIALLAFGMFLFAGCEKESIHEASPDSRSVNLDPQDVYIMSSPDGVKPYQKLDIDLELLRNTQNNKVTPRSGNTHMNGHFTGFPGGPMAFYPYSTVTFSATENSQGISGSAVITRYWGENQENSFKLIIHPDCIDVDGNDAVYSGILQQVNGDIPEGLELNPGTSRWWFKIRDNGQGPNAPIDEHHTVLIWNSSGFIPCETFNLSSILWTIPFIGTMVPVLEESDIIKIN